MPPQTPLARIGTGIVRPRTFAAFLCIAVLAIARTQQPASAHGAGDLVTDARRLDAALEETWKTINPTTQPVEAQKAFEQVRSEAERLGLKRQMAEALRGLASVEGGQERNDRARGLLEQALPLFQQSGDALGEARAVRQLAVALGARDHFEESLPLLMRARDAFKKLDARDDLALVYYDLVHATDKTKRDELVDEALAAARASSERWVECAIKHSLGDGQFNEGDYSEAYRTLSDALGCYEQTDRVGSKGRVLVSLGRIERVHGQFERALKFYQQAYALQMQIHDEAAALQSLNATAVAYAYMGRTEEARARYEEALARARTLGSERYITFLTGNLGGWYMGSGRYEEALPLLQEALAKEKTDANRQYRYWQIAESQFGLGRLDEALVSIDESIKLSRNTPERLMRVLAVRAAIEQRLNRLDASENDMREALSLVEELRRKTLAQDFMKRGFGESTQEVFALAVGVRAQRGDARGALEIAEQARARAFLDLLASRRSNPAAEGMLASATTDSAVAPYVTAQSLSVASTRNVDAPNANEMIATARRLRSTILVYWVGEHETLAWVIKPAGQIFSTTIKVDSKELADLARSTTALLRNGGAAGLAMFGGPSQTKPWRDLYRILVQPVRDHLPTAPGSLLTVVPHGPLFQVSFAALQDDQGKYLIESYRVHYTPSVGVLAYTAPAHQPLLRAPTSALLVGDPMPPATEPGDESLAELPWARREATEIGTILGARRARVVTGAEATETKVRAEIERADLLHFATHGVIRQSESMSSFLVLTRADSDSRPAAASYTRKLDPSTDGKLTADEVYGLRLHADLVVLSACGTALGPMTGDGVIGFTRAFLYAGARSVIATEWNVPDETGYELMKRFYRFRRMGSDTSESLRSAQLSLLAALRKGTLRVGAADNQVALREHPLYWAGFVLVGEP